MNDNNDNKDKRKRLRRYLTAEEIQKLRHHGDRLKELIDQQTLDYVGGNKKDILYQITHDLMSFDRPEAQARAKEQLDKLIKYMKDPNFS
jgi:sulfite reductase alpha subunit-like flavoprotein